MQLSSDEKIFSHFLSEFPESPQNLAYFENNHELQRLFVSELIACNKGGYINAQKAQCQKSYGQ